MTRTAQVQPPARGRRSLRIGRIVVEVLAAIFLLGLIVPWKPGTLLEIGPQEYSWMLMTQRAVVTGLQYGRQIVMPEGPLAFLGNDVYEPHTFPLLILGRIVFALVAFWSLWELGRKVIRTWLIALLWLMATVLLMGTTLDCFFADCAMLLLFNYFIVHGRKVRPSEIAMLVVLAAASLIKTNQLLYLAIAVTALTADQIIARRRRFWLPGCIYVGSMALFYLAARQSPASLGSFLKGWWLVLIGTAAGAAIPGSMADALMYLLVAAATVWLVGWSQWISRRWGAVCLLAATAAILLLLYKHSFVRQDKWHVVFAPTSALTLLLLYVPTIWRTARTRLRVAAMFVTAFSTAFLFWVIWSYDVNSPLDFVCSAFEKCGQNGLAMVQDITDPGRLTGQWESSRREIREAVKLPRDQILGTVDVYPHWQCVVFAYDLPYAPRPVCTSYVANTPALASLNARHLASPDAAETILINIAEVDDKFPTMLDGASYPVLLARYDLIDRTSGLLILRRSPTPRRAVYTPLSTQSAHFNETVLVPDVPGGMIWVRIHFKKRATYGLISALYQPATLHINVHTASGEDVSYVLLPDLAGQGFLLSPLSGRTAILAELFHDPSSPHLLGNRVRNFTVTVTDSSLGVGLDPDFTVSFERLQIVK